MPSPLCCTERLLNNAAALASSLWLCGRRRERRACYHQGRPSDAMPRMKRLCRPASSRPLGCHIVLFSGLLTVFRQPGPSVVSSGWQAEADGKRVATAGRAHFSGERNLHTVQHITTRTQPHLYPLALPSPCLSLYSQRSSFGHVPRASTCRALTLVLEQPRL